MNPLWWSEALLPTQMIVEAGLRLYDTEVREHRLSYHARHVARFECLSESIWVVEGDQAEVALPGALHIW